MDTNYNFNHRTHNKIITWILIIILIIALITIIYLIYKKLNIVSFLKQKQAITPGGKQEDSKRRLIDDKLQKIKERLG